MDDLQEIQEMQAEMEPKTPEWTYSPIDRVIYNSKFEHDAMLRLTGDFEDDEQKTAYAEKLCALLNGSHGPNDRLEDALKALRTLQGYNEHIRDGKINFRPEDHLYIINLGLNGWRTDATNDRQEKNNVG